MWIVPKTKELSAFVQDMGESSSDLNLQASRLSQWLMWRSKPGPVRTWLTRLKREKWLQRLSMRTLNLSHSAVFEARYTASLEDIHANPSARLASDSERRIQDTYGLLSGKESISQIRTGAFLKMLKGTSRWDSTQCSAIWKRWVTTCRRVYSLRRSFMLGTEEKGSSYWPTAAARDWKDTPGMSEKRSDRGGMGRVDQLPRAVYHQCRRDQESDNILGKSPEPAEWPTPTASTGGAESAERKQELGRSRSGGGNLKSAVDGKLNPDWVCQLMGVPVGWVNPEGAENRVDELRMLGNGVYPPTAALAMATLLGELEDARKLLDG